MCDTAFILHQAITDSGATELALFLWHQISVFCGDF